jgi:hypothetical protein
MTPHTAAPTAVAVLVLLSIQSSCRGDLSPLGVIEQHATMEHGRVGRAAQPAGQATGACMCGPAWHEQCEAASLSRRAR